MLLGARRVHGIPTAVAAGLLPAAAGVLVNIPVCARIHIAIRGFSCAGAVSVCTTRPYCLPARRSLNRSCRSLRRGVVLRVGVFAVLGNGGTSPRAIPVRALLCGGGRPCVWVIRCASFG